MERKPLMLHCRACGNPYDHHKVEDARWLPPHPPAVCSEECLSSMVLTAAGWIWIPRNASGTYEEQRDKLISALCAALPVLLTRCHLEQELAEKDPGSEAAQRFHRQARAIYKGAVEALKAAGVVL